MCTQYLHHIHPFARFPHHLPPPTGTYPSLPQAGPVPPPLSNFVEETNDIFLFNIAMQGVPLFHFNVYTYIINQISSSPTFLHSTLVLFLQCFQLV
jgi:hypothetical protein